MKKEYIAPELENLGSLEELTLGQLIGNTLDADFAIGKLFGNTTISN